MGTEKVEDIIKHWVGCKSPALGNNWETVHLCWKVGNSREAHEEKGMRNFQALISEL